MINNTKYYLTLLANSFRAAKMANWSALFRGQKWAVFYISGYAALCLIGQLAKCVSVQILVGTF